MAKGRLKSKTKIQCLKNEKQLSEHIYIKKTKTQQDIF